MLKTSKYISWQTFFFKFRCTSTSVVCYLQAAHYIPIGGSHQCNTAHFLISSDNREQTFKASSPRKPPIMWQRSPSKYKKSRLSWECAAAGGKETESHKWQRNICLSHLRSGDEGERAEKENSIAVLVPFLHDFGWGWSIAGKRFIQWVFKSRCFTS